jgi:hypothetical protein
MRERAAQHGGHCREISLDAGIQFVERGARVSRHQGSGEVTGGVAAAYWFWIATACGLAMTVFDVMRVHGFSFLSGATRRKIHLIPDS